VKPLLQQPQSDYHAIRTLCKLIDHSADQYSVTAAEDLVTRRLHTPWSQKQINLIKHLIYKYNEVLKQDSKPVNIDWKNPDYRYSKTETKKATRQKPTQNKWTDSDLPDRF
jgi:4-diphosphocytidyl-2C-methyl-D-erythritol kinase